MRMLTKNKQKMFYALYVESLVIYERDEDGNLIIDYVDENGKEWYREQGSFDDVYSKPIEFMGNISSKLNELHARAYGVDSSSIYSEICVKKGSVPLKYNAKIWRENEIVWIDEELGIPDESSADYTVKGIMTEGLTEDWYLLQRNN